jgi:hypothetical protein
MKKLTTNNSLIYFVLSGYKNSRALLLTKKTARGIHPSLTHMTYKICFNFSSGLTIF